MQYGVTLPNVGVDARMLADLAHDAEVAGWDGVFMWDSVHSETSGLKGRTVCDPWVALTAIAMCTERVRRYDGVSPAKMNDDGTFAEMTPADIQEMRTYIKEHRIETTPFDIVMEGETPGEDHEKAASIVQPFVEAGVTWWLEAVWGTPETQGGVEGMRARIKQGPPL